MDTRAGQAVYCGHGFTRTRGAATAGTAPRRRRAPLLRGGAGRGCRGGGDSLGEAIGPRKLERKGVRELIVEQRMREFADAIPGDLVLLGPQLHVRVDGPNRSEPRALVIAPAKELGGHEWEAQQPQFVFGGTPHEMRIERLELRLAGDRPAIYVRGSIATRETRLRVTRVLRIADVGTSLRVTTRVTLEGGATPRDLHIVERPVWGGESPVAPLTGRSWRARRSSADWLGREMDGKSVAIGAYAGDVHVTGRQLDHGRVDLLRFTDVELPNHGTKKGQWAAEAMISTSPSGLGDAVRRLGWTRGKPFVEAEVKLDRLAAGRLGAAAVAAVRSGEQRAPRSRSARDAAGPRRRARPAAARRGARARARSERSRAADRAAVRAVDLDDPGRLASSRSRAKQAATGELLPVRIRVLPRETTPALDLGPDWVGSGALDTVIAPSGRASIPLPAGYYRVLVTHGPEFSMYDEKLELDVGESARIDALLEHVVDPGPWVACDFHVHAAPSADSEVTSSDRVASLVAEGIAFAVPTDHNHVTDYARGGAAAAAARAAQRARRRGDHDRSALRPLQRVPVSARPRQARQRRARSAAASSRPMLFAALHAVDPKPIVQVNHPRIEGGIGYFDAVDYDPAPGARQRALQRGLRRDRGLERLRSRPLRERRARAVGVARHARARPPRGRHRKQRLAHDPLRGRGYPRTYVRPKVAGAVGTDALIAGLREGRAFVTSGPFLSVTVDGHGPGDTVTVEGGGIDVTVNVQIPAWMAVQNLRIYLGDQLVQRVPLDRGQPHPQLARRHALHPHRAPPRHAQRPARRRRRRRQRAPPLHRPRRRPPLRLHQPHLAGEGGRTELIKFCSDPAGNFRPPLAVAPRSSRAARAPHALAHRLRARARVNGTCESSARMSRTRALGPLLALVAALLTAQPAAARRGGIAAEGCDGCHRAGQAPSVQILALPANPLPGQDVAITVEIEAVNGSVGGFYFRLEGEGALTPAANSGIRAIAPDQLVHSAPRAASGGVVRFALTWTAPSAPGGAVFRAWAVSGNGDNSSSGDGAATAELLLAYGCTGELYALDPDGDGYGAAEFGRKRDCSLPMGYAQRDGDCAEYDPKIHPDAEELCNDKDDDCDGKADEALPLGPQYPDADGDGYGGGAGEPITDCSSPKGYAAVRGDCNDNVATTHPEATESCNFVDDDCDGRTDEKARADCGVGWCRRLSDSCSLEFCSPGMPRAEMCNYLDDDCDDVIDEGVTCAAGQQCIEGRCVADGEAVAGSGASAGAGALGAPMPAGRSGGSPTAGGRASQPSAAGNAAPGGTCAAGKDCDHPKASGDAAGGCAAAPLQSPQQSSWLAPICGLLALLLLRGAPANAFPLSRARCYAWRTRSPRWISPA